MKGAGEVKRGGRGVKLNLKGVRGIEDLRVGIGVKMKRGV